MTLEKLYRLIGNIVMPISYLLAFFTISTALGLLSNPSILVSVFIMVCLVVYLIKSSSFFRKNIGQNTAAKNTTKHLIYINGAISLIFVIEIIFSFAIITFYPATIKDLLKDVAGQLSQQYGQSVSSQQLYSWLKGVIIFLFIYALLLTTHIIMSFVLIKKYQRLFQ